MEIANRPQDINIALPQELIRADLVQWIPTSFVVDVTFIFHVTDLLPGKYLHTNGVIYAFFCQYQWSTNLLRLLFTTMTYFSICDDS